MNSMTLSKEIDWYNPAALTEDSLTTYTVVVNWDAIQDAIQDAMVALDKARRGPVGVFGHTGVTDALGGSYFHGHFRSRGLAGLVDLAGALRSITAAAWDYVHGASRRVDEIGASYTAGWVVMLSCNGAEYPVTRRRRPNEPRVFTSHRGAAIVAGRRGGRVAVTSECGASKVAVVHDQARAAVRTMLAARSVYQLLSAAGVLRDSSGTITAGANDGHVSLTGLAWLAGQRVESGPIPVELAARFADGEPVEVVLESVQVARRAYT